MAPIHETTSLSIHNSSIIDAPGVQAFVGSLCESQDPSCFLQNKPDCVGNDCAGQVTVMLFPFVALTIGVFIHPVTKVYRKIPYTLVLLFFGFFVGALGCTRDLGLLTLSLQQWVHLNPPHLFFYVFLAPLIFEAAYTTEWHIFKRLFLPIFVAGFILVLIQVFIIAGFTRAVTSITTDGWSWMTSLMFASMLCATDPTPIVSFLKSINASGHLTTMIEGESLVNDLSSVLWEVFVLNSAAENDGTIQRLHFGNIVGYIAKAVFGGFFLGCAFSLVAIFFLYWLFDEFEAETSITVILAFLGFWIAQSPCKVSGVICTCTSGYMLSAYAKNIISKPVSKQLPIFWDMLKWIANTIVFFHSGVLAVTFVWPCKASHFNFIDYAMIFVYFLFLLVVRVLLFLFACKVLSLRDQWLTWQHGLIAGLSGSRGAVCLILALLVAGKDRIPSEIRTRVFVWTTGVVTLSLILNVLIVNLIIPCQGLVSGRTETRLEFLRRARANMTQATLMILDSLVVDLSFTGTRWHYVMNSVFPPKWMGAFDDMRDMDSDMSCQRIKDDVNLSMPFNLPQSFSATNDPFRSFPGDLETPVSHVSDECRRGRNRPLRSSQFETLFDFRPYLTGSYPSSVKPFSPFRDGVSQGVTRLTEIPSFSYLDDGNVVDLNESFDSEVEEASSILVENSTQNRRSISVPSRIASNRIIEYALEMLRDFQQANEDIEREADNGNDIHDSREIRRRVLEKMLTQVRDTTTHTFFEYVALLSIEEDIMSLFDANDEKRFDNFLVLLKRKSVLDTIFRCFPARNIDSKLATLATTIFLISSDILQKKVLELSHEVRVEAENLYEGAAYVLSQLSQISLNEYSWVKSQIAIQTVSALQDDALAKMLKNCVIDKLEYETLQRELRDERRHHNMFSFLGWGKKEVKSYDYNHSFLGWKNAVKEPLIRIISNHPLFKDSPRFVEECMSNLTLLNIAAGKELPLNENCSVLVLKGALRPTVKKQRKGQRSRFSTVKRKLEVSGVPVGNGGSVRHWVYTSMAAYFTPAVICEINNARNEKCVVAEDRLYELSFQACSICEETIVLLLPDSFVRDFAADSKEFRNEATRWLARDLVLDTIRDEKPFFLSLFRKQFGECLSDKTWAGRAFSLLEKLPYMKVLTISRPAVDRILDGNNLPPNFVRGPGLLVNGIVKISTVPSFDQLDEAVILYERVEGPALLPSENLIIEDAEQIEDSATTQNVNKRKSTIIAHILVVEDHSSEALSAAQVFRWTADADITNMNGRFGMNGHVSNPNIRREFEET